MKKILSILLALTLVVSIFSTFGVTKVYSATDEWDVARYGNVIDFGTQLRVMENDEEYMAKMESQISELAANFNFDEVNQTNEEDAVSNFTFNGGIKYMLALDQFYGYYLKTFTLRSIGENVEVWVADDLSYQDGRAPEEINQEQVDHMRDVFDETVYPTDTAFFGMHDSHTGENAPLAGMIGAPDDYYTSNDGEERVMILVDLFKDTNYYYPDYPLIIGGFYSPSFEGYMDRNIINISARSWEYALDSHWLPTTAHEFQHLIHDDNDPLEDLWLNEGMSDFAEYLCFGEHPMGHVNAFLDYPENSLVEWDDHGDAVTGPETLADYGQAYLLQLYLNDHFGKDFIQALAKNENHGIESVNEVFANFGEDIDFEELFKRFTVAAAIDSPQPGNGIYNFNSIDINVNFESALEYDKDGVPAWGADYKVLDDFKNIRNVHFNGSTYIWDVVEYADKGEVFWSNNGNNTDNYLFFEADLTNVENATLKFDTFIDIEAGWDAGMVQVSLDNGETWISLSNENTIDQDEFEYNYQAPEIYNNLPGFSLNNTEWVNEEFDLTAFAGENILISFRYMTDSYYNDTGWFIDNIEIPEIGFFNDCSSVDGFTGNIVEYAVTFINKKVSNISDNVHYNVLNIDPFNLSEEDSVKLQGFFNNGTNYMIVWYAAEDGRSGTAQFEYEIETQEDFVEKK